MNEHDSQRMREVMEPHGFRTVDNREDALVVVLNSCDIREKAKQKLMSELGRLKALKRSRPEVVLCVAGCVSQLEGEQLFRRAPHVDVVVGTDQLRALPEMVARVRQGEGRQVRNAFWDGSSGEEDGAFVSAGEAYEPGAVTAFVTVMTGCDKKCAYCVVPYTRGRERSRPAAAVLEEVRRLVGKGVTEVMLIGQTVNTYGQDLAGKSPDFAALLTEVAAVPGLLRVRFMTSHPRDVSDRLVEAVGRLPSVAPHLHLPVQSGSDRVLARMGRGYTRAWYVDRVGALRAARPDLSVTSDVIVGFPGETEEDFQHTVSLLDQVRFDGLFSFAYSERPGTAAEAMDGVVPPDERRARLNVLQARQRPHTRAFMEGHAGRVVEVLVEGTSRNDAGVWCGKTGQNVTVNFQGAGEGWRPRRGGLQAVVVGEVRSNTLFGRAAGA
jgi:tRNA-2-methylthio-N6-dimethylallyladenosine synthase